MSHNIFQKTVLSEDPLCYFTLQLKTTTGVQNPSELAAVVSYYEYSRELVRWESWGDVKNVAEIFSSFSLVTFGLQNQISG